MPIFQRYLKTSTALGSFVLSAFVAFAGANLATAETKANPCAAKNPAKSVNPCAAANPCAANNPLNPCAGGHIKAPDAAHGLAPDVAEKAYRSLQRKMAAAFTLSGDKHAKRYQKWKRYNNAPYESSQHGDRYLNNYANNMAQTYEKYENIVKMPIGSVIAKDSFTVLKDGRRYAGPLFLMEKMKVGFRPEFGDWRYSMILPDGSLVGVTNAEGSENVDYCGTCHAGVAANQDHLFFLPKSYRVK